MVIATFSKCIVKVPETVSFRSYHKLKAILACSSKVQLLHNYAVCSKLTPETYLHNRQHVHKYFSPPTAQPGVCPGQDTWPKPSRVLHSGTAWGTRMELGHFLSDPSRNLLLLLNKQKLPWSRGGNTSHTCQNKNKDDSNASIISHCKRKKKRSIQCIFHGKNRRVSSAHLQSHNMINSQTAPALIYVLRCNSVHRTVLYSIDKTWNSFLTLLKYLPTSCLFPLLKLAEINISSLQLCKFC